MKSLIAKRSIRWALCVSVASERLDEWNIQMYIFEVRVIDKSEIKVILCKKVRFKSTRLRGSLAGQEKPLKPGYKYLDNCPEKYEDHFSLSSITRKLQIYTFISFILINHWLSVLVLSST